MEQELANWKRLVAIAIISFLGLYAFTGLMAYKYGGWKKDAGWGYSYRDRQFFVSNVSQQGAAAGILERGDIIREIDGDSRVTTRVTLWSPIWLKLQSIKPGEKYSVGVERKGQRHVVLLQMQVKAVHMGGMVLPLLSSLAFLIIAIVVGLKRPESWHARLFAVSLTGIAAIQLATAHNNLNDFYNRWEQAVYYLMWIISPFHIATIYHFNYRFPEGVPKRRVWNAITYLLYGWAGILWITFRYRDYQTVTGIETAIEFAVKNASLLNYLTLLYTPFFIVGLLSTCLVTARNYSLVTELDQKRRIRWIVYGSALGTLPLALVFTSIFLLSSFGYGHLFSSGSSNIYFLPSSILLIIIPLSWGYAIVKHRLFDIKVVIRRGLQYLLAKNGLRLVMSIPFIYFIVRIVLNPNQTIAQIFLSNYVSIFATLAIAGSFKYRQRLADWIDHKFFREEYDSERILIELVERVKGAVGISELSNLVCKQIEEALHPKCIHVYYRQDDRRKDMKLGYSTAGIPVKHITEESTLLKSLDTLSTLTKVAYLSDISKAPEDHVWLEELGVVLVVPMNGTDGKLIGLLLLGEKASEEPYSAKDKELLGAVTSQIAIVYENLLLKDRVHSAQKIQREVLTRFEGQNVNIVHDCPYCRRCYDSSQAVCPADGYDLTITTPVERVVDGKYRLEQLLGKGGMGSVYEATDLRLSRRVAIKIMLGQLFGDLTSQRRFEREARASAKINHPNVVAIYDFGQIRQEGSYLVMEYLSGCTLSAFLQSGKLLHNRRAAYVLEQVLSGVAAAHRAGIIHRDLKPGNIILDPETDLVKVLDFGLAKFRDLDSQQSLTLPGTIMGTFGYMSPEQLSGKEADERSDIFSLGVIVVETITGKRPFSGRNLHEMLANIHNRDFQLAGTGVEHLNSVLRRAIAERPEQRYSSVEEFQKELIPALQNAPEFPTPRMDVFNEETII